METIKIAKAPAYTSPNPMTLICTRKDDGTTNLASSTVDSTPTVELSFCNH